MDVPDVTVHLDALLCEVVLDNAGRACAERLWLTGSWARLAGFATTELVSAVVGRTPWPISNAVRHGDPAFGPISLVVTASPEKQLQLGLTFTLTARHRPNRSKAGGVHASDRHVQIFQRLSALIANCFHCSHSTYVGMLLTYCGLSQISWNGDQVIFPFDYA